MILTPERLIRTVLFMSLAILLAACERPSPISPTEQAPVAEFQPSAVPNVTPVQEHRITPIALEGPLADKKAEISSLVWYQDNLILLPQHPTFNEDGSFLYALPKSAIEAYLDGESDEALRPQAIPFSTPDFIKRPEWSYV